jgi:hypothetical protein
MNHESRPEDDQPEQLELQPESPDPVPTEATVVAEVVAEPVAEAVPETPIPSDAIIVKVSLPADGNGAALVHTEGKRDYWYLEVTEKLVKRMAGMKTRYFYASLRDGKPKLDRYASHQPW